MTKPQTKPCISCAHYDGAIPCKMGHRPRYFKEGGLRRVCNDFDAKPPSTEKNVAGLPILDVILSIFGMRRV